MMGNIAEVRSRGATVVLVANDGDDDTAAEADDVLWVPTHPPALRPGASTSSPCSSSRTTSPGLHGHDVDRPRNLAKTVTVE